MATKKNTPSWSDVKTKLVDFDRAGLLGLLQNLYAANKDNQAFLHARLSLGDDVLKPYKVIIDRWLWPDVFKNQDTSVAKAKKPIADYKKAIASLADAQRQPFWDRLDAVRSTCHNFGYGVGDDMDDLLAEYEADD